MGLKAVGVSEQDAWSVLRSTALDSTPLVRRKVFEAAARERAEVSIAHVAQRVRYYPTTVRRTLEELAAHRLVEHIPARPGRADGWILAEDIEMLYSSLFDGPFPKRRVS